MSSQPRAAGLTIVELLVVVAIIGVLVALLLPAIQIAREAARQTACRNNLKQICLAILQYSAASHEHLPASWRTIRDEHGRASTVAEYSLFLTSFSWRTSVLPYLGEQSLNDGIDYSSTPITDANSRLSATKLTIFQCPSTPDSPRSVSAANGRYFDPQLGANDYSHVMYVGAQPDSDPRHITRPGLPGAWYALPRYEGSVLDQVYMTPDERPGARGSAPLAYISDGLSHTALLAEKAGFPNLYVNGNLLDDSPWGDGIWVSAENGGYSKAPINWSNFPSIYSFHPSCAHIGLCDGSVRALASDTDTAVIVALCSRDAGEAE
jgi:type II secretory pathway pseudopilin PulG